MQLTLDFAGSRQIHLSLTHYIITSFTSSLPIVAPLSLTFTFTTRVQWYYPPLFISIANADSHLLVHSFATHNANNHQAGASFSNAHTGLCCAQRQRSPSMTTAQPANAENRPRRPREHRLKHAQLNDRKPPDRQCQQRKHPLEALGFPRGVVSEQTNHDNGMPLPRTEAMPPSFREGHSIEGQVAGLELPSFPSRASVHRTSGTLKLTTDPFGTHSSRTESNLQRKAPPRD
ncbi:hypothetical protein PG985_010420 [Apiospora marii]|uniref:Uncharacterized protein n=1 Tax=Apiospora marii TaxID=335849 RepID=A0ABR1RZ82_9PEZI